MRALLLGAALLQGCVFIPQSTRVYDEECKAHVRHMTLRPEYLGSPAGCGGKECAYVLAVIGAIAAGSFVVSGSVVVIGNTVYWLEKKSKCLAA